MAVRHPWVGCKKKPPTGPIDFQRVDPSWSWVYNSLVAAWLWNQEEASQISSQDGEILYEVFGRMNGKLFDGGNGFTPFWIRTGELWGTLNDPTGSESGITIVSLGDPFPGPLSENFTPERLSIETWSFWAPDQGLDPRLFTKQTSSAEADHIWMVGSLDDTDNDGMPRFRLRTGGTTQTHVQEDNDNPVANDLVHMVWTYDGQDVRLYINGHRRTILSPSQTGTVNGGDGVPIGISNSAYPGANNEWAAPIYKVAIYTSALSKSQVVALSRDPYGAFRPMRQRSFIVSAGVNFAPLRARR